MGGNQEGVEGGKIPVVRVVYPFPISYGLVVMSSRYGDSFPWCVFFCYGVSCNVVNPKVGKVLRRKISLGNIQFVSVWNSRFEQGRMNRCCGNEYRSSNLWIRSEDYRLVFCRKMLSFEKSFWKICDIRTSSCTNANVVEVGSFLFIVLGRRLSALSCILGIRTFCSLSSWGYISCRNYRPLLRRLLEIVQRLLVVLVCSARFLK